MGVTIQRSCTVLDTVVQAGLLSNSPPSPGLQPLQPEGSCKIREQPRILPCLNLTAARRASTSGPDPGLGPADLSGVGSLCCPPPTLFPLHCPAFGSHRGLSLLSPSGLASTTFPAPGTPPWAPPDDLLIHHVSSQCRHPSLANPGWVTASSELSHSPWAVAVMSYGGGV